MPEDVEVEPVEKERPRRRMAPPRSKSSDDSGSLAVMRAARGGANGGESSREGEEALSPAPRRGGRRAPARTKSSDDMDAMGRMTRYARQKSKEDHKVQDAVPEEVEAEAS
jgi:hypothetical protein